MLQNEPNWLSEYRKKNQIILEQKPLKKSQYFDVTNLDEFLKINQNKTQINLPKEIQDQNIKIITWSQALKEIPDKIKFILEKEEPPKNQYEAFINACFNTGFIIIVKKDSPQRNLIKYKINNTSNSIIKNIIIVEENIQDIKFLEHLEGEVNYLNQTLLIENNSKVSFCRIFNLNEKSIINQQNLLEKDSILKSSNAFLNGNFINTRIVNSLRASGANLEELDISFLDKNQFFNLDLLSIHKASDAKSHSILKAVLSQNSKNLFDGMIKILPTGQKTNALLQAHSLLLSKDASSNNIPSLEIEADDVKATHSATVSNLDDDQLFYLESKGLSRQEARHIIVKGFLENIIFKLPKEYIEPLSRLLEQKIK